MKDTSPGDSEAPLSSVQSCAGRDTEMSTWLEGKAGRAGWCLLSLTAPCTSILTRVTLANEPELVLPPSLSFHHPSRQEPKAQVGRRRVGICRKRASLVSPNFNCSFCHYCTFWVFLATLLGHFKNLLEPKSASKQKNTGKHSSDSKKMLGLKNLAFNEINPQTL